jgi:hypothetical protein
MASFHYCKVLKDFTQCSTGTSDKLETGSWGLDATFKTCCFVTFKQIERIGDYPLAHSGSYSLSYPYVCSHDEATIESSLVRLLIKQVGHAMFPLKQR